MNGRWESNINVWFPFMYSQKWNCAASLFPTQNYNVLSPNSYTQISLRDLYISRIGLLILLQPNMLDRSWEYINHSQTYECRNWDRGRTIPFLGIHKLDFWYRVYPNMAYGTCAYILEIRQHLTQTFDANIWRKHLRQTFDANICRIHLPPIFWESAYILSKRQCFMHV